MAGFIQVSNDISWSASNWVYWGLMDYVIEEFKNDSQTSRVLVGCKWMHILNIPTLQGNDPSAAERIVSVLRHVADRCALGELDAKVEGRVLDEPSQQQFKGSMVELVRILSNS